MTDDEIDSTPAGRGLDILIGVMMGENVDEENLSDETPVSPADLLPRYSKDLRAAWQVVEFMHKCRLRYVVKGHWDGQAKHWAAFDDESISDPNPLYQGWGETPMLAICRAALKAMQAAPRWRKSATADNTAPP